MQCLITGATGVVGSALCGRLLQDEDTVLHLLIRADSDEHLAQRLDELIDYWGEETRDLLSVGRIVALRGDAGRPRLGLAAGRYECLVRELTHVVHAAGNVKLNQSLDEARRNTLEPLEHVVALCRRGLEAGSFRKLEYTSTVGVLGRRAGVLPENRFEEPREFHNHYERAKAEAEQRLFEEIDKGLPATIHRPSMVVGDSRTGRVIRRQVFYYLCAFLTGRHTLGFLPDLGEATLDTVPCDAVAELIRLAMHDPAANGCVLHECGGPADSIRLVDLVSLVRRAVRDRGEKLPHLRTISPRWFRRMIRLAGHTTRGRTRQSLRTLPYFLDYLAQRQAYAVESTRVFAAARGIATPRPADYLGTILRARLKCHRVTP